MTPRGKPVERVIIYRSFGGLGDLIVALPLFHLVAREYPNAERILLTGIGAVSKVSGIESALLESGLVHRVVHRPRSMSWKPSNLGNLWRFSREIARLRPDTVVVLADHLRNRKACLRETAFFRLSGARSVIGMPFRRDHREERFLKDVGRWEHRVERLARCLSGLGRVDLEDPLNWSLRFNPGEAARFGSLLEEWTGGGRFIALSLGTARPVNEWGDERWGALLARVSAAHPTLGLVLLGSPDERERCRDISAGWMGPVLNLCGGISVRGSAWILSRALLFLGHDSGPIHLAAAMGAPCFGIYSARHKPGVWFPRGVAHRVFYRRTACFDCRLERCNRERKECMDLIEPAEVADAINEFLRANISCSGEDQA